jgi:hypothetical protein
MVLTVEREVETSTLRFRPVRREEFLEQRLAESCDIHYIQTQAASFEA